VKKTAFAERKEKLSRKTKKFLKTGKRLDKIKKMWYNIIRHGEMCPAIAAKGAAKIL
jgi:hypothetical protein